LVWLVVTLQNKSRVPIVRQHNKEDSPMNPKIPCAGIVCAALCALTCTNPSSPDIPHGVVVADTYEPDSSQSFANPIVPDSAGQFRTLTKGDTDWVSFSAIAGRSYTIFTDGNTGTRIKVYSSIGPLPAVDRHDPADSVNASVVFNCFTADTCFIRVSGGNETSTGAYELSILSSVGPDVYEPDSIPSRSKSISATGSQDRTIQTEDVDWINCSLSAYDTILLVAAGSCRPLITLYDRDTVEELAPSLTGDTIAGIRYQVRAAGTYFIKVVSQNPGASGPYRLTMQTGSGNPPVGPDPFENDNTRNAAKLISGNSVTQQRTLTPHDTDWVIYAATFGDSVAILTTGTTGTKISVFPAGGSTPVTENDGIGSNDTSALVSWTSPLTGQFYVRIIGKTVSATGPYLLQALCIQIPVATDSFEDDNTRARARLISDTVLSAESHSLTISDTDWVAFPVCAGGQCTVTVLSTRYLSLYAITTGDSLIGSRTGAMRDTIVYAPVQDDTMYVRVSAASAVQRYTLSMSRVAPPSPDAYEVDNAQAGAYRASGPVTQVRTITINDTDWVSVPAQSGGKYTLSTSTAAVRVTLYNQAGILLGSSTSGSLAITATASGPFYYQMTAASSACPAARYTLTLTVVLPVFADSFENDNDMGSAKPLSTDGTVQNRTITLHDTDYVSIRGNAGDRVMIQAVQTTACFTILFMYDSAGVLQMSTSTGSNGLSYSFVLPWTGLFYCRITSLTTSSFSYGLSATLGKIDTLVIGTESSRYLIAWDTQFVAVRLDSGKTYTIQTTGSLDMRLWLFDSLKAVSYLLYDDDGGDGANALLTCVPQRTGLFILRVSGLSTSTAGNFGLIATDSGAATAYETTAKQMTYSGLRPAVPGQESRARVGHW
jgi:hypothetical protein